MGRLAHLGPSIALPSEYVAGTHDDWLDWRMYPAIGGCTADSGGFRDLIGRGLM